LIVCRHLVGALCPARPSQTGSGHAKRVGLTCGRVASVEARAAVSAVMCTAGDGVCRRGPSTAAESSVKAVRVSSGQGCCLARARVETVTGKTREGRRQGSCPSRARGVGATAALRGPERGRRRSLTRAPSRRPPGRAPRRRARRRLVTRTGARRSRLARSTRQCSARRQLLVVDPADGRRQEQQRRRGSGQRRPWAEIVRAGRRPGVAVGRNRQRPQQAPSRLLKDAALRKDLPPLTCTVLPAGLRIKSRVGPSCEGIRRAVETRPERESAVVRLSGTARVGGDSGRLNTS
jgi:hypothetical protein